MAVFYCALLNLFRAERAVTEKELKRLHRRFKKLDKDGSGTLTIDEFTSIPELAGTQGEFQTFVSSGCQRVSAPDTTPSAVNPLLERVISIFDTNKDHEIEFQEFISALSTFSDKGNKEGKLQFAFKVYDIDGDGFISNGELFQVLKMMVGDNLNDIQLQQIVDKTILEGDDDRDGRISYEEFKKMINNVSEIEDKLTISFDDQTAN